MRFLPFPFAALRQNEMARSPSQAVPGQKGTNTMSSSTGEGDDKVVLFRPTEITPEERARRLKNEVERLTRLPTVEWRFYASQEDHAQQYGVTPAGLRELVESVIKENEKKALKDEAEDRRREERAEKQQATVQREQKREQERAEKEARKEDERKQRERTKEFAKLLKLPTTEQESRLAALAKRLDEDPDILRDQFTEFAGVEEDSGIIGDIEPWPEPIDTQTLLTDVMSQLRGVTSSCMTMPLQSRLSCGFALHGCTTRLWCIRHFWSSIPPTATPARRRHVV
jgi:hypothetical protein